MLALYILPFYLLLHGAILWLFLKWVTACTGKGRWIPFKIVLSIIYGICTLSIGIGFLAPEGLFKRNFCLIGNYWLGITLYEGLWILLFVIIYLIARRVNKKNPHTILRTRRFHLLYAGLCILLIIATCVYGAVNAHIIRETDYEVAVEKDGGNLDSLRIALVADLHLGYNIGCSHMEQMVEKINAMDADLVVMAGDIFDNDWEAVEDPERLEEILRGIKSKYGVYAVYGNHDIQEKILAGFTFGGDGEKKVSNPEMDTFLEKSNITLLRDEAVLIDDSFYLYGRPDYERLGRGIEKRKTADEISAELDQTRPIIVIDHEPRELQELSDAGVDIDLCGHTHDGQLFPANLTSKLIWENSAGYLKKGNMHNIVTSGVGLFGPFMRVGTIAEVCRIDVTFK